MPPHTRERRQLALLAWLYGVRPWEAEELTPAQLGALLGEAEWILMQRERAARDYQFLKSDHDFLANPTPVPHADAEKLKRARQNFLRGIYNLPELHTSRYTDATVDDLQYALSGSRVPGWALNLVDLGELQGASYSQAAADDLEAARAAKRVPTWALELLAGNKVA